MMDNKVKSLRLPEDDNVDFATEGRGQSKSKAKVSAWCPDDDQRLYSCSICAARWKDVKPP